MPAAEHHRISPILISRPADGRGCQAELAWAAGYIPGWYARPKTVTPALPGMFKEICFELRGLFVFFLETTSMRGLILIYAFSRAIPYAYATGRYMLWSDVCLSVCLSKAAVLSKRAVFSMYCAMLQGNLGIARYVRYVHVMYVTYVSCTLRRQ